MVSEVVSPSHRAWIAVLLHFFDGVSALVFGGYGSRLAPVLRNGAGVFPFTESYLGMMATE